MILLFPSSHSGSLYLVTCPAVTLQGYVQRWGNYLVKTLIPVLLLYSSFSDHSLSLWKWRKPTWSKGWGIFSVVSPTALGLFAAHWDSSVLLWPSQGVAAAAQTVQAGALLHSMVLTLGLEICNFRSLPQMLHVLANIYKMLWVLMVFFSSRDARHPFFCSWAPLWESEGLREAFL